MAGPAERSPGWRSRVSGGGAAQPQSGGPGRTPASWKAHLGRRVALYAVAVTFLGAALAVLDQGAPPVAVRPGERTRTDIRARVRFRYSDPDAFNQARDDRRKATPPIYLHEPRWAEAALADVDRLLDARAKAKTLEAFRKLLEQLKLVTDLKLAEPVWLSLGEFPDPAKEVCGPIREALAGLDRRGVLSEEQWKAERWRAARLPDQRATIERRPADRPDAAGERVPVEAFNPEDRVRHEEEVRQGVRDYFRARAGSLGEPLAGLLEGLVLARVRPSMQHNKELSEAAVAAALAAIGPAEAVRRREKEDILLRAGDEIGAKEMLVLRAENRAHWAGQPPAVRVRRLGGLFLSLAVLLGVTFLWIARTDREALDRVRQMAGLAVLGVLVLAAARAAGELDWPLQVVPVIFFATVAALTLSVRSASALALAAAALAAVALGAGFGGASVLGAGALAAALAGGRPRHRLDLLKAALAAGLVSALAGAGGQLLEGASEPLAALRSAGWGLGAALGQGLFLAGALPVLEAALGTVTSISLLELCDQNHPLLKATFLNAPGTHQHSLVVGMLSENGAEAIGADPLLARAGGYYHDIGKIARPEYFVENITPGQNRHDRLGSAMSALVVTAHVRDGAALAREYRLPRAVLEVIEQHHGTTLAEFFYRRALERGEQPAESLYRYPGPKPRTKEAAIVLLADAVEAASRSLEEPSVARLKALVHDLASRRLADGQFDECGLTLKELAAVEAAFTRILTSMFHSRVAYPEAPEPKPRNGAAKA
jgi:hypothetical protein